MDQSCACFETSELDVEDMKLRATPLPHALRRPSLGISRVKKRSSSRNRQLSYRTLAAGMYAKVALSSSVQRWSAKHPQHPLDGRGLCTACVHGMQGTEGVVIEVPRLGIRISWRPVINDGTSRMRHGKMDFWRSDTQWAFQSSARRLPCFALIVDALPS